MRVISDIELRFKQVGVIGDYSAKVANNNTIVSVLISSNGLQTINLPQSSFLDSKHLKAVEVLSALQVSYGYEGSSTMRENLPENALGQFLFKLKKDSTELIVAPFSVCNTKLTLGKYYEIDSAPFNHCIGDSELVQIDTGTYSGYVVTFRFWYD